MTRPKAEGREWFHAWTTAHETEWVEQLWARWLGAVGLRSAKRMMEALIASCEHRQWPPGVDGPAVLSMMRTMVA